MGVSILLFYLFYRRQYDIVSAESLPDAPTLSRLSYCIITHHAFFDSAVVFDDGHCGSDAVLLLLIIIVNVICICRHNDRCE